MSMMVSPYAFAYSPVGDALIAAKDFTSGTATGTISATTSAFGGSTPKAAIILGSHNLVSNEPNETIHLGLSFAVTDGTRTRHFQVFSGDGRTIGSSTSRYDAGAGFQLPSTATANVSFVSQPSFVSNGLSLNVTTNTGGNRRCAYLGFSGASISAYAGTISLGTGTSAIDVTAPGFQPDVVLLFGACANGAQAGTVPMVYSLGAATSDGVQRSVSGFHPNNVNPPTPWQAILSNRVGFQINSGGPDYTLTASDFDSSGFSVTPSASTSGDVIFYLALKMGGRRVKIIDITTPTSTGSVSVTGVGFRPQAAIAFMTNLTATDPTFPITTSDEMSGIAVCLIADQQWSASVRDDSGASTTDAQSQFKASALVGPSATDCDAITASLTSWDADGLTLNYTATQGTAKKGFMVLFE